MFLVNYRNFNDFSSPSHALFVTKTGQAVKPALFGVLYDLFRCGCLLEKQFSRVYRLRIEA
jgi:hypothetical protein